MKNAKTIRRGWAVLGFGLVALAACSTVRVRADRDDRVDLARYRTFKVAACQAPNVACAHGGTLVADRIAGALRDQSQARGLRPEASRPDLIVVFATTTRTKIDLVQPEGVPPWGGLGGDIWTDEARQETVLLNFLDARTNRTVWTALAQTEQQNLGSAAVVQRTVARALESYPPL